METLSTTSPANNYTDIYEIITLFQTQNIDGLGESNVTWILLTTFIIFTMQTGFALLESGSVSSKSQSNVMVMCLVDAVFGGSAYWLFGYALSFGRWRQANAFVGVGDFALDVTDYSQMGNKFVKFVFQMSFATTATTIVSGALAERVRLRAYVTFAFFNVFTYSVVAHWIWDPIGWLRTLGVVDVAGSGVVHLCGGTSALVGAILLGPRVGRFDPESTVQRPSSPTSIVLGTLTLWWGWLGFNCGSTYGVSNGLWKIAARTATTTLLAPISGGITGVIFNWSTTRGRTLRIPDFCNGILGGLVAVTAPCAVIRSWEGVIIGFIGGLIAVGSCRLVDRLKIDDPVGAIPVHFCTGIWGLAAVGLFANDEPLADLNNGQVGLFHGGGWYSLGIQCLAAVSIITWSGGCSTILLGVLRITCGIRLSSDEERLGADHVEHGLKLSWSALASTVAKNQRQQRQKVANTNNNVLPPAPSTVQLQCSTRRPKSPQSENGDACGSLQTVISTSL